MKKGGQPWAWIDGSDFDFTPQIRYNENGCMSITSGGTYYPWDDSSCYTQYPYICQMRG